MARPLVDWLLLASLVKGSCASNEVIPGQLPGHTRCAVAIDPGVEEDSRNGQEWQTLKGCKSNTRDNYSHSSRDLG